MRLIERCGPEDVIEAWVRAELDSSRFGAQLAALLERDGHTAADLDDPAIRLRLLAEFRGGYVAPDPSDPYVDGLRLARIDWWRAELSRDELPDVRYIDWDYWLEVTDGSRRPMDFVRRLERDADGRPDMFDDVVNAIRAGQRLPTMILVDTGPGTRIVVAEGHLRLTAYLLAGEATPERLPVLLGRSPLVADWSDY